MSDAFFTLYQDLDREGPGEPADVAWAAETVRLAQDARICDAGCGSGGDLPALLAAAPEGRVTAIDIHEPFIDEVIRRVGADPRVATRAGDIADIEGPYDLIWSAGAVYFLGIEKALTAWRSELAPGGAVAFSEPCYFAAKPSEAAREFWEGYPTTDAAGIEAQIHVAGYETVATRRVSDAAWENYYRSLEARVSALRSSASGALGKVLDAAQSEIEQWRSVKNETGYLLSVVRPR